MHCSKTHIKKDRPCGGLSEIAALAEQTQRAEASVVTGDRLARAAQTFGSTLGP